MDVEQKLAALAADAHHDIGTTLVDFQSGCARNGSLGNTNTYPRAQELVAKGYRTAVEGMARFLISANINGDDAACAALLTAAGELASAVVPETSPVLFGSPSFDRGATTRARVDGDKLRVRLMAMAKQAHDDARLGIVGTERMSQAGTNINVSGGNAAIATGIGAQVQQQVHQGDIEQLRTMLAEVLRCLPADDANTRSKAQAVEDAVAADKPDRLRNAVAVLREALGKMRDSGLVELGKRLADWL